MAKIEHIISGLANGVTYYGKVYTANPKKRANDRADLMVFAAIPSAFPVEPTAYELIGTYTTSRTWTAPEDGWFKIEVFGASGNGGTAVIPGKGEDEYGEEYRVGATGGGGASGGYSASVVKLFSGDKVTITPGSVGSTSLASVASSYDDTYSHTLTVTSGGNGGNARNTTGGKEPGSAGVAGTASGGDVNINGNAGSRGTRPVSDTVGDGPYPGGSGGAAVVSGGNAGGNGGGYDSNGLYASSEVITSPGSGKAGFIKISRGNTNVVA